MPIAIIKEIFKLEIVKQSLVYRLFLILDKQYTKVMGVYLIFIFITPHEFWRNVYSLIASIIFFI